MVNDLTVSLNCVILNCLFSYPPPTPPSFSGPVAKLFICMS